MKNIILTLFSFLSSFLFSQTYTLQPNAADGIDAVILDDDANTNFGISEEFIAFYWSRQGHNYEGRSLIKFDLSSLPSGKTVTSAKLSLYWDQLASAGQSGDNDSKISRITSAWNENTVTWNTKPAISTSEFLILPKSTSTQQDYIDIDITSIVSSMYTTPSSNFGFLIEQIVKNTYRSMKFASSDYTVASKRPKLVITLATPCVNEIALQPNGTNGIDAVLKENDANNPSGNDEEFITYDWSFGGVQAKGVSLLKFDLSSIPSNATLLSAKLSLFHNPGSASAGQFGDNTSNLKRITSSWNENTVTWNSMPTTTDIGKVNIPMSTSSTQNYIDFDVLSLVSTMYSNQGTNYGMMLQLVNQGTYRSMKFCSSDYTNASMRPRLKICYSISNGMNALDELTNKKVYPNPAKTYIYLYGFIQGSNFSITNSIGAEVLNGVLGNEGIDVQSLPKGMYFLKVENTTQKININ